MFWNAQEQEERDYHPQSELQNLGMMNRKPDDTAKIQKAIQEGKHVVIESQTEFCPYTDAILGNRQLLVSYTIQETKLNKHSINYTYQIKITQTPISMPSSDPIHP